LNAPFWEVMCVLVISIIPEAFQVSFLLLS